MAQRVEIVLEDDIDGSVADETVEFSFDGSSYEIDLTGSTPENSGPSLHHGQGSPARSAAADNDPQR